MNLNSSISNPVTAAILLLAVPAVILISRATHGSWFPHLPGRGDVWNIQYLPLAVVAAVCVAVAINALRYTRWRKTFVVVALVNLGWCVTTVLAIIQLWGEKY